MIRTAAIAIAAAAALGFAPRPAQAQRTLTCESEHGRREVCRVDTRGGVRLVRRLSDTACIQGRNWGYASNYVWVDDGCRARFEVGSSSRYGRPRGGGGDDRWDDRYGAGEGARLCERAVARRLGVRSNRIDAWSAGSRGRDRIYRWRGAGRDGTCRIQRDGDVHVSMGR